MNYIDNVFQGDCLEVLKTLPDGIVDCCVTSPPYYGLRDYGTGKWVGGDPNCPHKRMSKYSESTITGHKQDDLRGNVGDAIYKTVCPLCGAVREDKQIGLESTPEEYIQKLVDVFREVKRVLKDDGTLWVNIGDSYWGSGSRGYDFTDKWSDASKVQSNSKGTENLSNIPKLVGTTDTGIKNKDLVGIPWMLAFALRADGWYLRQDIIWCLSGGTYLYVKTSSGIYPMMIKDMLRLNPKKVQLWNGERWVNVIGWGKSNDTSQKIELVLRSGERIQCTGNHKWVLSDGTEKKASELSVGDVLMTTRFADEGSHNPAILTDDILWLIGLWLAEGSRSDDCIQLSLHANKLPWLERIKSAVESVGGTTTYTVDGNRLNVRIYSQIFNAVLHQYLGGRVAKDKHLKSICWRLPNEKLKKIVMGYFDGDGHYDDTNNRVRLGFTRNYDLERDFRVLANRLGATLTLNLSVSKIGDKEYPSFRGEWRWNKSDHWNNKERAEIIEIKSGSGRNYYDISVDCDNHLFALASGVLTHNCKPNPMPESVKDRCTKSHEYIFLLSKKPHYYFDNEAIQEPANIQKIKGDIRFGGNKYGDNEDAHFNIYSGNAYKPRTKNMQYDGQTPNTMHARREEGLPDKQYLVRNKRDVWSVPLKPCKEAHFATFPEELIKPCILAGCRGGGVVLDPFFGSGTTGRVAVANGRHYVGIELNPEYIEISDRRTDNVQMTIFSYLEGGSNV